MATKGFIKHTTRSYSEDSMIERSQSFFELMNERRSVRDFSDRTFDRKLLDNLIRTASTAPSGAHKQPWTFCVITNKELRTKLREKAEAEEKRSYDSRMSDQWLDDLEPIGTNHIKPFLTEAPYIVVVFKRLFEYDEDGTKHPNYYVNESVGIAVGMFLTAVHNVGLVALTHTPSPMNFLSEVLDRPANERAYVLIPVGYASETAKVPNFERKPLDVVCAYYD